MTSTFRKATRRARKLRMSIQGPAGSGKTRTALEIGTRLGGRVAVIDTEHSSADVYAPPEGEPADPARGTFDFDALALEHFAPQRYIDAMHAAAREGFGVLVIDSLSHAWMGEGGILQQADAKGGKFDAWKTLTPQQNKLLESILTYPGHVIVTMRTKTAYEVTKEKDRDGREKTKVEKVGTSPVQKDGTEYEFDIVIDIDADHVGHVTKTRCSDLEGLSIVKPGAELAATIRTWLEAAPEAPPAAPTQRPQEDPREVVARILSAIEVLDAQLGEEGAAVAEARHLLGGRTPVDLERAEAVRLIGGRDTPGPLRALRDTLKAAAAAK